MDKIAEFINRDFSSLATIIASDIQKHIKQLHSSGVSFYGYAALPPDHCTQPEPTTLVVAYNREEDVEESNRSDPYYRYCVNEWVNFVYEGFEATNSALKFEVERFRELCAPYGEELDDYDYESEFFEKVNLAILSGMRITKEMGAFDTASYLAVWFADSNEDIVNESVKVLNDADIYLQYAAEFE